MRSKSLTYILNTEAANAIRWCTPSIDPDIEKVKDPYKSDISVSYETFGYHTEPSGIFLEAYQKAAKAYGSDHTLFSVNGSSGSNFVVIRALNKQIPNLRILAQRNIHKSILHACADYNINLLFLDATIDSKLQIFLPNSIKEIVSSVKKTKPHVLLITNPTYEGVVLDVKRLIREVRKVNSKIIIFIEEAWGSHLHFSNKLPMSAMDAGADICVQSTHKQGSSLQQSGMIHWKNERINSDIILESYRFLSTTSPSYILLASLDAAREIMEKQGKKKIEHSLKIVQRFIDGLNEIPALHVVTKKELQERNVSVFDRDQTKILVEVSKSGFSGFELAQILEIKYNIIVEKYSTNALLFLVPFQSNLEDVKVTLTALKKILQERQGKQIQVQPTMKFNIPRNIPKILELAEVAKLFEDQIEQIPLKSAKGRIAAENICPYPPGIPTTIQGEEITADAIAFYESLHNYPNFHVLAHDPSLATVLVVK